MPLDTPAGKESMGMGVPVSLPDSFDPQALKAFFNDAFARQFSGPIHEENDALLTPYIHNINLPHQQ